MIPARLGSKRIKNKNLRLLNNKPLVNYIIEATKKAESFEEIYLNSEGLTLEKIAVENDVHFYHRPKELASDEASNDEWTLDFISAVKCDILIQLLPTSPFITPKEIDDFVKKMLDGQYDTLISVTNVQIEAIYEGKSINFNQKKKTPPSQTLEPFQAYACGIMGWRSENFMKNMDKYGAAYHGGDGKIGFYELKGFSTVDIDNEEDFILAETIARSNGVTASNPEYYNEEKEEEIYDANVDRILTADGVESNYQDSFNLQKVNVKEIIDQYGRKASWSHTVINSSSNSATLIAQMPGEGNRMHYHPDWDEWWYIIEGEWEWLVEGEKKYVNSGDVVFIERKRKHKITAVGKRMAIRLAVSRYDVDHVYTQGTYDNE